MGRVRRWTPEEDAVLKEHYPRHTAGWSGWESVLPGRSVWSRRERAYKIGATGAQGPRRDGPHAKPATCGACRFYRDGGGGRGRCMDRHARGLFGGAPAVKADYPTDTCEWGEAIP